MNVLSWHCSIGTFLSIPPILGCQMSWSYGRNMSMLLQINHLHQLWNLGGSTILKTIFLFQNSWGSFNTIDINILNTLTGPGGKIMNSSILMRYLSQEQSYQWQTSLRIIHLLPREIQHEILNDTLFIPHCFGLIDESLKKNHISFTRHWIW